MPVNLKAEVRPKQAGFLFEWIENLVDEDYEGGASQHRPGGHGGVRVRF